MGRNSVVGVCTHALPKQKAGKPLTSLWSSFFSSPPVFSFSGSHGQKKRETVVYHSEDKEEMGRTGRKGEVNKKTPKIPVLILC